MSAVIDKTLAKSLINDFQSLNTANGGPALLTPDGKPLKGFFVDRRCLDAILSDKNNVGVFVHFAKHPEHPGTSDNVITIILTGVEPNPAYTDAGDIAPFIGKHEPWDQVLPCPPYCVELC